MHFFEPRRFQQIEIKCSGEDDQVLQNVLDRENMDGLNKHLKMFPITVKPS